MSCRVEETLARARACLEEEARKLRTSFSVMGESVTPEERISKAGNRLERIRKAETALREMLEIVTGAEEAAETGLANFLKAHPELNTDNLNNQN